MSSISRWMGKGLTHESRRPLTSGNGRELTLAPFGYWDDAAIDHEIRLRLLDALPAPSGRPLNRNDLHEPEAANAADITRIARSHIAKLQASLIEPIPTSREDGAAKLETVRDSAAVLSNTIDPIGEALVAVRRLRTKLIELYGRPDSSGADRLI